MDVLAVDGGFNRPIKTPAYHRTIITCPLSISRRALAAVFLETGSPLVADSEIVIYRVEFSIVQDACIYLFAAAPPRLVANGKNFYSETSSARASLSSPDKRRR